MPIGDRTPFNLTASALAVGATGATLVSPLYPVYQQAWTLTSGTVTIIYVSYMVGLLSSFLFLGRLSDRFNAMSVLRAAMGLIVIGLLVSAIAWDAFSLMIARFILGIGAGLTTSSATIALKALEPKGHNGLATLAASSLTMLGFALGPFVAGLVGQSLPSPLVTPYALLIIVTALNMAGMLFVRMPDPQATTLSLKPKLTLPSSSFRPTFVLSALATFAAFSLFSLIASLAPSFVGSFFELYGVGVGGIAVSSVLFLSAGVQVIARSYSRKTCLRAGLGLMSASTIFLASSLALNSWPLFVVSVVFTGTGHGLSFMGSFALATGTTTKTNHAGVLSAFFSIGYLGAIIPTLATGFISDALGVGTAVTIYCMIFTVASAVLFISSLMMRSLGAGQEDT